MAVNRRPQILLLLLTITIMFCYNAANAIRIKRQKLTAYDENYAKLMAVLSAGAYATSPNECIKRWIPDANLWRVYTLANQACDALEQTCASYTVVSERRRELVVVFRGTKTSEQLFLEGWQSLRPGNDFHGMGKVNNYFNEALNVLWPNVEQALKDANHANFRVTFTGHSLGGALAALGAAKAVATGLRTSNLVKLYTFGEPRVGNSAFAFKHDQLVPQSFRVVFRKDIVPHLPPCLKNNSHISTEELMDEDNKPCDPHLRGIAYHHGTEIWYPKGMPALESKSAPTQDQHYYECVGDPHDEDFACSDSISFEIHRYKSYIWDHRHYFGHRLPVFGKLGCNPDADDENEEEVATKVQTGGMQAAVGQPAESAGQNGGKNKLLKAFGSLVTFLG